MAIIDRKIVVLVCYKATVRDLTFAICEMMLKVTQSYQKVPYHILFVVCRHCVFVLHNFSNITTYLASLTACDLD